MHICENPVSFSSISISLLVHSGERKCLHQRLICSWRHFHYLFYLAEQKGCFFLWLIAFILSLWLSVADRRVNREVASMLHYATKGEETQLHCSTICTALWMISWARPLWVVGLISGARWRVDLSTASMSSELNTILNLKVTVAAKKSGAHRKILILYFLTWISHYSVPRGLLNKMCQMCALAQNIGKGGKGTAPRENRLHI